MSSHIQLVERGRIIGLDGKPWATTPVNGWSGLPCEVHAHMRRGEVAQRQNPHPLVFLRYGARGRSRIVSGSRVYDLGIAPMQVDVFAADFRMDHGWWDCTAGEVVSIEVRAGALAAHDDPAPPLRTMLCGVDPTLARLVDCMRREIDACCPSGRLFAEGLSLAVLGRLQSAYASTSASIPTSDALPEPLRGRIVDYIEAHLGDDLRIASLADLAGLSGAHFIRVFRRAFGKTPHRYVVERRLEAAKALLAGRRSLASIAHGLGFSSQAHFTQAYRRHYGATPGRMRRAPR